MWQATRVVFAGVCLALTVLSLPNVPDDVANWGPVLAWVNNTPARWLLPVIGWVGLLSLAAVLMITHRRPSNAKRRQVASDELGLLMQSGQALHQQAFWGRAGWADVQGWIWRTREFLTTVFGPAEAQLVGGVALVPTENLEQVVSEYVSRLEALVQRLDRVDVRVDVESIRAAGHKARRHGEAIEPPGRIGGVRLLLPRWRNRQLLAEALTEAYRDGVAWYDSNAEYEDWAGWEKRTRELVEAALGEGAAQRFVADWKRTGQALTGIDARRQHLFDLIQRVDSVTTQVQLRDDFDGRDWVSRK